MIWGKFHGIIWSDSSLNIATEIDLCKITSLLTTYTHRQILFTLGIIASFSTGIQRLIQLELFLTRYRRARETLYYIFWLPNPLDVNTEDHLWDTPTHTCQIICLMDTELHTVQEVSTEMQKAWFNISAWFKIFQNFSESLSSLSSCLRAGNGGYSRYELVVT